MSVAPAPSRVSAPLDSGSGGPSVILGRRRASLLAYAAGWISGLLLLLLESRDREVRWHAAQAFIGFGALNLMALAFVAAAGIGLFSSITIFRVCIWIAQGLVAIGAVLWVVSLVQVARGRDFRWPLITERARRLAGW